MTQAWIKEPFQWFLALISKNLEILTMQDILYQNCWNWLKELLPAPLPLIPIWLSSCLLAKALVQPWELIQLNRNLRNLSFFFFFKSVFQPQVSLDLHHSTALKCTTWVETSDWGLHQSKIHFKHLLLPHTLVQSSQMMTTSQDKWTDITHFGKETKIWLKSKVGPEATWRQREYHSGFNKLLGQPRSPAQRKAVPETQQMSPPRCPWKRWPNS